MFTENYDVIGVTETWLNTENRDFLAEYKLPGYTIFEKSRTNRMGGGILFYVKDHLSPVQLVKPQIPNIDTLYLLLKDNLGKKIVLGLIYRPPAQHVHTDREIYEQISEICNTEDTVMMGDFNLPVPKWGEPVNLHTGHDLYANLQESSLTQLVHSPTRDDNILDLVFTTNEDLVENLIVNDEFSNSDHRAITFNLSFTSKKYNISNEKIPDYRKANFQKMRETLANTDWSQFCNTDDINAEWQFFIEMYAKAVHECIPLRKRRTEHRRKPNWWTNEIANCLRDKKNAHIRLKTLNNDEERAKFTDLRRKAKRLINQSKRSVELHIANRSKENPKEFYKYIREKRVVTSTIGPLTDENGASTRDEHQMSNILNTFFASVFTTEDTSTIPVPPTVQFVNNNLLNNVNITEREVLNCIDKLKLNKSPGPDTISPRVLKEARNEFAKPLTTLFNKSLQLGIMPDDWKLANVTPILKKRQQIST